MFGVGPILAAKIIGRVGNVEYAFPPRLTTAPPTLAQSSHRGLKRRGDTSQALASGQPQAQPCPVYDCYLCQARHDTEGRAYYRRKLAEGNSEKEALRCLKRRISNTVYRHLCASTRKEQSQSQLDTEEPRETVRKGVLRQ